MWFSFRVGNISHILCWEGKKGKKKRSCLPNCEATRSHQHHQTQVANSTMVTVCSDGDPTHPGLIYSEQTEGGFSSNCCTLQKALCWTHSGSQWRPYILRSALSLCHGGLWMSSLLGCGSVQWGGVWGRGRKQVVCVCSIIADTYMHSSNGWFWSPTALSLRCEVSYWTHKTFLCLSVSPCWNRCLFKCLVQPLMLEKIWPIQ